PRANLMDEIDIQLFRKQKTRKKKSVITLQKTRKKKRRVLRCLYTYTGVCIYSLLRHRHRIFLDVRLMDCDANENHHHNHHPDEASIANIEDNSSSSSRRPGASSYIYRQDVVKRKPDGKTGIVTEVAGDSESSDTTTSDDDDDDDIDSGPGSNEVDLHENVTENSDNDDDDESPPLPADHVRVLWIDESETTHSRDDVIVVDRGFLHGDYVAAACNATGQVGVVVDVSITVDLSSTTIDGNFININNVSSKDLKRVRDFQVGDYVLLGPWLGRIDDVLDNVTVMFDDGSVCKVMKADPMRLKPVGKNPLEDAHYPYYPGYGPDSSITPSEEQSPKNLRLLSCFSHANWQLGDWCLLPSPKPSSSSSHGKNSLDKSESDSEVGHEEEKSDPPCVEPSSLAASVHETWPLHRKKLRKVVVKRDKKSRKKEQHFEKALQITSTKTRVDVAWQDGNIQRGLDSISLIPIENPGDHEFVAEQYVVGPQAIYVVGRDDDDDDSVGGGSELSDDAASWETVEDTEMDSLQMALEDLGIQNASDTNSVDGEEHNTTENVQTNGALSIPLAALGFMTRLASGIFSRGQRNTDDSRVNSGGDNEALPHNLSERNNSIDSGAPETPNYYGIKEEDSAVEESNLLDAPAELEADNSRFKGFDIVKDPLDHYYLGANAQNNAGRRWLKKVQQDWNILKKNLPDGIYVRVYENRMDLLRA
ncbi:hypothetical protein M8C21_024036, partial [Ambrosia artemisiifolia]